MSKLSKMKSSINLSQGLPINIYDRDWSEYMSSGEGCNWQYMPVQGAVLLNSRIKSMYGDSYHSIITSGCTESLLCSMYCLKTLGYESIVVPEPFYSYYPMMCKMAGLRFISSRLLINNNKFEININDLRKINNKTAILINTPHNPTGMVISSEVWQELISICIEKKSFLLVDDVYREFNYTSSKMPYKELSGIIDQVLISGSLSKSLAASGLRVGWLVGSKKNIRISNSYHMHMSNCTADIIQRAAASMIDRYGGEGANRLRKYYKENRNILYSTLINKGMKAYYPRGGHFVTVDFNDLTTSKSAKEICISITNQCGVTPLPLDEFHTSTSTSTSKMIRFSFSVRRPDLLTACDRLSSLNIGKIDER